MPAWPQLLIITDRHLVPDLAVVLRRALLGTRICGEASPIGVLLREKDLPGKPLLALARRLREVTFEAGARLLVSDRVDVAQASGADGVHLPATGLPEDTIRDAWPEALIGRSCHRAGEVRAALERGADYVTFGPVFETPSKIPFGKPPGLPGLRAACGHGPVIALGGIDLSNADEALATGASGLACIRAVLCASDPSAATRALIAAIRGA